MQMKNSENTFFNSFGKTIGDFKRSELVLPYNINRNATWKVGMKVQKFFILPSAMNKYVTQHTLEYKFSDKHVSLSSSDHM